MKFDINVSVILFRIEENSSPKDTMFKYIQ